MKKIIGISLTLILSLSIYSSAFAAQAPSPSIDGKPYKVESIKNKDNTDTPVLYFYSKADADKYKESIISKGLTNKLLKAQLNGAIIPDLNAELNGSITPEWWHSGYSDNTYYGPRGHEYQEAFLKNYTTVNATLSSAVARSHTTTLTISVGSDFSPFFKLNVGVALANTTTYTNTFSVVVPPNSKASIMTWNESDLYGFQKYNYWSDDEGFNVWRPTNIEGSSVVIWPL